ncbi:hypothetical protein LT679_03975 [Mucilaginibacter roseus]|uniref:Glycosyltransferase n=1 Tax=Mucilaginibacter roseus TaxID=1528868 RepID=A0ABS8TXZ4_9SPHI|nr:hypothetical protein [Mucilaginibacter roseus]MCD8739751.1 hypothetical protein [Mucilaginibacter roseus]
MMNDSHRQLLVIAPTCPPGVCGVSDHAFRTALALGKYYLDIKIGVQYFPADKIEVPLELSADNWEIALKNTINSTYPTDVLLNYTPKSYSRFALPFKLLSALRKFKKASPANRLFIYFHETWDGGKHLKAHHKLLDTFTKYTVKTLSKRADAITVVTNEQKQKLESVLVNPKVHLSMVGANILPFDKEYGLKSARNPGEWIIFGLAHTRLWTLQQHLPLIKQLYQKGGITKLYAIGPKDNSYAEQELDLANTEIGQGVLTQMGVLKPAEVSAMMLSAEAALVGQTADSLRKSGTFAALSAHAVPVVCEAPFTLDEPPGYALFRPQELMENYSLVTTAEGEKRRQLLHQWFWLTRSWEAIALDMYSWIKE